MFNFNLKLELWFKFPYAILFSSANDNMLKFSRLPRWSEVLGIDLVRILSSLRKKYMWSLAIRTTDFELKMWKQKSIFIILYRFGVYKFISDVVENLDVESGTMVHCLVCNNCNYWPQRLFIKTGTYLCWKIWHIINIENKIDKNLVN